MKHFLEKLSSLGFMPGGYGYLRRRWMFTHPRRFERHWSWKIFPCNRQELKSSHCSGRSYWLAPWNFRRLTSAAFTYAIRPPNGLR